MIITEIKHIGSDSPLTQIKQALCKSSLLAPYCIIPGCRKPHAAGFMYNNHLLLFYMLLPLLSPFSA